METYLILFVQDIPENKQEEPLVAFPAAKEAQARTFPCP